MLKNLFVYVGYSVYKLFQDAETVTGMSVFKRINSSQALLLHGRIVFVVIRFTMSFTLLWRNPVVTQQEADFSLTVGRIGANKRCYKNSSFLFLQYHFAWSSCQVSYHYIIQFKKMKTFFQFYGFILMKSE